MIVNKKKWTKLHYINILAHRKPIKNIVIRLGFSGYLYGFINQRFINSRFCFDKTLLFFQL